MRLVLSGVKQDDVALEIGVSAPRISQIVVGIRSWMTDFVRRRMARRR